MSLGKIVSKLINLQQQADSHAVKYLHPHHVPVKRTQSFIHYSKAGRLRSRIQKVIHEIAIHRHDDTEANAGPAVYSTR